MLGAMLAHLRSMLWLCSHLGAMLVPCSPILGLCWWYLPHLGAMLATFSVFTFQNPHDDAGNAPPPDQHNSHHLNVLVASCTHVDAILAYLEPRCFHDFTFSFKFCLKKLSPVACESHDCMVLSVVCFLWAPACGLQVSRFERDELLKASISGPEAPRVDDVGAMFAHLGAMLWLYWPPGCNFGLCCFHDFTFIPKFPASHMSEMFVKDLPVFELSPVACEFHVSSVFAPTCGLRVARTSDRGGRRRGSALPLAKLDFLQRWRSRIFGMAGAAPCLRPRRDYML